MSLAFFPFKYNIQKGLLWKGEKMKQIICFINNSYNWIWSINLAEITLAQEKNETSLKIGDSHIIRITQIDESMETNNTSPQANNNIPLIK